MSTTVRYSSPLGLFGWPLLSIARGPDELRQEVQGYAKGFIAIGDSATGVIAIGGVARGLIAIGGVGFGLITIAGVGLRESPSLKRLSEESRLATTPRGAWRSGHTPSPPNEPIIPQLSGSNGWVYTALTIRNLRNRLRSKREKETGSE